MICSPLSLPSPNSLEAILMADLQITDTLGLVATLEIRDDSPLAKAKITQISSLSPALRDEFTKPLDQTSLKGFSFGAKCSTPNASIGSIATITLGAGVCGEISIIRPVDKTLFPSDTFSQSHARCYRGRSSSGHKTPTREGENQGFPPSRPMAFVGNHRQG